MKFPLVGRFRDWYRRNRGFARATAGLSVALIIVAAVLTVMVLADLSGPAASVVFSFSLGTGIAIAFWLGWTTWMWYQDARSRKDRKA